jgi:hypothetical protein
VSEPPRFPFQTCLQIFETRQSERIPVLPCWVGMVEIRADLGRKFLSCNQAIVCASGGLSRQSHLRESGNRSRGILFDFLDLGRKGRRRLVVISTPGPALLPSSENHALSVQNLREGLGVELNGRSLAPATLSPVLLSRASVTRNGKLEAGPSGLLQARSGLPLVCGISMARILVRSRRAGDPRPS